MPDIIVFVWVNTGLEYLWKEILCGFTFLENEANQHTKNSHDSISLPLNYLPGFFWNLPGN